MLMSKIGSVKNGQNFIKQNHVVISDTNTDENNFLVEQFKFIWLAGGALQAYKPPSSWHKDGIWAFLRGDYFFGHS